MMKYGKSISVEELFEPVRCALRCRWRRNQALLLLSLQTGQVAYWQNGEHSWQEQLNEECLADKQRLTDVLREILLARDVEEGAAVLLLPAAATVYSEQLLFPLMRRRELQAALQWEVQQSVPWMHEDYTYSFEAHVICEADEWQYQVMFAALQNASRAELEQLCRSLMLKLQGILLGSKTIDEAADKWFAGKSLPSIYRQKQRRLQGIAATFGRYLTNRKDKGASVLDELEKYLKDQRSRVKNFFTNSQIPSCSKGSAEYNNAHNFDLIEVKKFKPDEIVLMKDKLFYVDM